MSGIIPNQREYECISDHELETNTVTKSRKRKRRAINNDIAEHDDPVLGSPIVRKKVSASSFPWIPCDGNFNDYSSFKKSITNGGVAAGASKAKFFRYNVSKGLFNQNGEFNWATFSCGSCPGGCTLQVTFYFSLYCVFVVFIELRSSLISHLIIYFYFEFQRQGKWNSTTKLYDLFERGQHTAETEHFLAQTIGIDTQCKEETLKMLQEKNMAPKKVIEALVKIGIKEANLPSTAQISNLKSSLRNDHSADSKHRLSTLHDLEEFFSSALVNSKAQYEALGY